MLPPGAPIYATGYPASGLFRTPAYFFGSGQYFCNDTFDGDGWWQFGTAANGLDTGTWVYPREMTGGSPGGPVFTRLVDGSCGLFGVVNRGHDTRDREASYTGEYQLTSMFDDRFLEFYNGVVNAVNAGGVSASSASIRYPEAVPVAAR